MKAKRVVMEEGVIVCLSTSLSLPLSAPSCEVRSLQRSGTAGKRLCSNPADEIPRQGMFGGCLHSKLFVIVLNGFHCVGHSSCCACNY